MSSTSQTMLNQGLFDDQGIPSQMGFYSSSPNWTYTPFGYHQSLRTLNNSSLIGADHITSNLTETILSSATQKHRDMTSHLGDSEPRLVHRSSTNFWPWGEMSECLSSRRSVGDDRLGVTAMKMKKVKARRKVREPRFCFKTMSDVDVLDDGYKWRKYGQKVVKNTQHPRSYYRCTQDNCRVKKRVERLAEDPRMVITTYEGRHVHSPSHDLDDSQDPSHINNFFW
ncbi:hypothetical protein HHK36_030581 [Tetracentron sinense]|uniref:WRKY domain-containing protein n=1 Tax=Tetracentron sinense TaxID=13715 RepID=A0A834Y9L6_TETSI|nr:hypothetical protein HHK36_030581 [Tetracentron sinense]